MSTYAPMTRADWAAMSLCYAVIAAGFVGYGWLLGWVS